MGKGSQSLSPPAHTWGMSKNRPSEDEWEGRSRKSQDCKERAGNLWERQAAQLLGGQRSEEETYETGEADRQVRATGCVVGLAVRGVVWD